MDEFAERLKKEFSKGKSKDNLEYSRAASKLYYIRRRNRANWDSWNEQQRKEALRLQKDAIGIFSDQNCSNQIGTLTTNEPANKKSRLN